jgi:hypothetical protein
MCCPHAAAPRRVQAVPESLLMLHGVAADEAASGDAGLFLHVGLSTGVLQRTEVDRITGACRPREVCACVRATARRCVPPGRGSGSVC